MLFFCKKLLYKIRYIFLEILFWNKTLQNPYENIKIKEHFPKTFRVKLMCDEGGWFVEGCTHFNNPVNCFETCSGLRAPNAAPNLCREKLSFSLSKL